MAINLATDALFGKLAIVMNQTLFGIAAPNEAQLEAQIIQIRGNIPYFRQFAGTGASEQQIQTFAEIKAFQQLVAATLTFPQFAGKTALQQAQIAFQNITGHVPSTASINSLLAAYNGDAALLIANLIVQESGKPVISSAANLFLAQASNGTAVFGQPLIITNHVPTDIVDKVDLDHTLHVLEHSADGTTVGTLRAIDSDAGDAHTFALVNASNLFQINSATGEITLKVGASAQLDAGVHILTVKATDNSGASVNKAITVVVDNNSNIHQLALTTGTDTPANLPGTPNDDVFTGATNNNSALNTANAGDTLDGLGGYDKLKLQLDGNAPLNGVKTVNIEEIELTNQTGNNRTVRVTEMAGVQKFTVSHSTGNVTVQDIQGDFLAAVGTVAIIDTVSDVTLDFDGSGTTGGADRVKIQLNEAGIANGPNNIDITLTQDAVHGGPNPAEIETVDIETTGAPSAVDDFNGGHVQTLNITGNQDLAIGDLGPTTVDESDGLVDDNPNLTRVDASGLNANLSIVLASDVGAGNEGGNGQLPGGSDRDLTYLGAKGDDTVYMGRLFDNGFTGTVDGKTGNNTLVFGNFNAIINSANAGVGGPTSTIDAVSNFQTAAFQDDVGGALNSKAAVLDAQQLDGVRTFDLRNGIASNGNWVQILDLQAGQTHNVIVGDDSVTTAHFQFGVDPTVPETTTDNIDVTLNDPNLHIDLNSTRIEQYQFNVLSGSTNSVSFESNMGQLNKVVVTGGGAAASFFTLDDPGANTETPNLHEFDGTQTNNVNFNLTDVGWASLINTGNGNDTINGGVNGDTINSDGGTDIVHGLDGNDNINLGDNGPATVDQGFGDAGNDTVRGGNGNDLVDGGTGSDQVFGDAGNDTVVGGSGNDLVDGGQGADLMTGGSGVAPFGADPSVTDVKVGGLIGTGDQFTIAVDVNQDGLLDKSATVTAVVGDTAATIAAKLAAALASGAGALVGPNFAVSSAGDTVRITENDGSGFNVSVNTSDGAPDEIVIPDTARVVLSDNRVYDDGDVVSVTIAPGQVYNFNVTVDGTTAEQVAAGLAALINGGVVDMSAIATGNVIDLTGLNPLVDYNVSASTSNTQFFAPTVVADPTTIQEGESLTISITGFGSWTETRQVGESELAFYQRFLANHESAIIASPDVAGQGLAIVDTDGGAGQNFALVFDAFGGLQAKLSVTQSISGPVTIVGGGANPLNANANPSVSNGHPTTADDNTQSLTVNVVKAGETNGADKFVVDISGGGNIFTGAIDKVTDFGVGGVKDTIDFAGINSLAGASTFVNIGEVTNAGYAGAFAIASSVIESTSFDYVAIGDSVTHQTWVFAGNHGEGATQAVELIGVQVAQVDATHIVAA